MNHEDLLGVLDGGEQHTWSFDQTAFGWNGPMSVPMQIDVCRGVLSAADTPFFAPPEWAMSEKILGNSAITSEYLHSPLTDKEIKKRVADIKKSLAGYPAKKQALGELKKWYKANTKYGSFTRLLARVSFKPSCNPSTSPSITESA